MLKWTKIQEWFKCMRTICQFDQKNKRAAIQIIEFHETQCMHGEILSLFVVVGGWVCRCSILLLQFFMGYFLWVGGSKGRYARWGGGERWGRFLHDSHTYRDKLKV